MRFLDTNIIIRFLTRDDESKAEACFQLFQRIKRGEEEVFTCEAMVTEVAYVLTSSRTPYRLSHAQVKDRLLPILSLRGVRLPHKRVCIRALDIYASAPDLDLEDALAAAHMEQQGLTEIYSYDRDFDGVEGVTRLEP